ncbi:MAG: glycosyltransferase family 2 protein [Rhodospirillaceae bacterium]|nr:glycosyltransferase family 2 protein [Rhodospirillaceae bacterium]
MNIFCLLAVRDEERYLPGFLHHIRDHVDGILALDDCSIDGTAEILKNEPRIVSILRGRKRGPPHANEANNRHRLLVEAARLNARWLLCADADERFEKAFLRRVRSEAEKGERDGRPVRDIRLVNLWNSPRLYRADGLCGPRWAPRMFKLPEKFTRRASVMHRPWFPPELDSAPRARMNAYLYHLRMIDAGERKTRYEKFRSIDPNNDHQSVGYDHLIDENGLRLRPVLPWRQYDAVADAESPTQAVSDRSDGTGDFPPLPDQAAFDEFYYVNKNTDVQHALARGEVASGWDHFARIGRGQGRNWRAKAALDGLDFAAILGDWRNRKS